MYTSLDPLLLTERKQYLFYSILHVSWSLIIKGTQEKLYTV